jgi:hypothetical protein
MEEVVVAMKKQQEEDKLKFIKLLAEEIVNKMVEMGHNPTPRVRDYIG